MSAPHLPPILSPGLGIFPGYTAQKAESFMMKEEKVWTTKDLLLVSFISGAAFMRVQSINRKEISFQTMQGREVLRIVKKHHTWTCKGSEYRGIRPDGSEAFYLSLKRGITGTGYDLKIYPSKHQRLRLEVQKNVMGQKAVVLVNGSLAAALDDSKQWSRLRSQYYIHVAPGMDILLALAVNWVRHDKQNEDRRTAATVS